MKLTFTVAIIALSTGCASAPKVRPAREVNHPQDLITVEFAETPLRGACGLVACETPAQSLPVLK